jgi:ABC-type multidrug transport system fused ATPase/permease subunit
LSSIAQEDFGNIRTIKAFANEKLSVEHYNKQNLKVTKMGATKARVWGCFMFGIRVFQNIAFAAIMYIIGLTYSEENMTLGKTMAYLLYM